MSSLNICGIFRYLLLAVVFCATEAPAEPRFPALSGRVVDQAELLSQADEADLGGMLAEHEHRTGNQVVVVTLRSLEGYDIADYGYQLGRYWGIGEAGRDNGALLMVAPRERGVRIEVGYGLEGVLTDARAHQIIQQEILPRFKAGDLPGGIRAGLQAVLALLEGENPVPDRPARPGLANSRNLSGTLPFFVIVAILFVRQFLGGLGASRAITSLFTGSVGGAVVWLLTRGLLLSITIAFVLALITFVSGGPRGPGRFMRRRYGYYDDFDGGLFGGGGFSGRGGSFGGGGASGRW